MKMTTKRKSVTLAFDMQAITKINDGQTIWYARTAELAASFAKLGYTADTYQGIDVIVEPPYDEDDEVDAGKAYSDLCASTTEALEPAEGADVEFMSYDGYRVGQDRWYVSGGLHAAIAAANG